ncbi:MAG: hypothetical protein FJ102_08150 [Deltaproteobacteria bacterium]|nr:hypothetical protein [Deltaproteobacteria bacterium]
MRLPLPRLPLQLWLLGSYALVFAMPVAALLGTGALAWDLVNQTKEDLEHQGALIAMVAAERMGKPQRMNEMLAAAKQQTLSGIRITDDAGVVVASSGDGVGEDLSDDAEIRAALEGSQGLAIKPRPGAVGLRGRGLSSQSRHADVRVFVAVPITRDGEVLGAVILSRTPREEFQAFWQMAPRLWLGALLAVLSTAVLALLAGHYASRSLRSLGRASERFAAGQLADDGTSADARDSRISETAALADAMEAMAARLRARLAYISEFAGNVSHEFKTPVSSLRGTIELLRDDEAMPAEQRARFLDNALGDLDRLSRLVGGLLRLARAEEGGARETIDALALARDVAQRYANIALSGENVKLVGAREQVETALANLVENARKYGGSGVRIEVFHAPPLAGFRVIDDGPGIDPAHLPRLFERFFTTDRARGGTGLGLALVKAVAEAHGGHARVESRPGRTSFELALRAES